MEEDTEEDQIRCSRKRKCEVKWKTAIRLTSSQGDQIESTHRNKKSKTDRRDSIFNETKDTKHLKTERVGLYKANEHISGKKAGRHKESKCVQHSVLLADLPDSVDVLDGVTDLSPQLLLIKLHLRHRAKKNNINCHAYTDNGGEEG